jgi:hypothetical protein
MCPACILTIGGGLLIVRKLGVNDILIIGLFTIILSFISDIVLQKINKGKVFFPYQRIVVSIILLILITLIFRFVK